MKKITLSIGLFICAFSNAQTTTPNWLEEVIVEKYYISTIEDSIKSEGILPVGSVTYRVFADMLPGYKFTNVYGDGSHLMKIATTTTFFNNEDRGAISPTYTKAQAKNNTIMLDSWFSLGAACADNWAVLKTEDDGLANVISADDILKNENPMIGIPLTQQDGMIAKKGNENIIGITLLPGLDLGIFDATSQQGGLFASNSASVAALGGQSGPTGTNRVLIGQFTTDGQFSFELNMQIQDTLGNAQRFVAKNAIGTERTIPSLIYSSAAVQGYNMAPTVAITAPAPYTKYKNADVIAIKANANDADGKISYVKFYVDNNYLTTDSIAPYEYDYTVSVGSAGQRLKIGAVAIDDKGATAITEPVIVFVEGANIPPYAKIISPFNGASYKKNSDIILKADAMDVDGTVKSVEFFMQGTFNTTSIELDSVAPYEINWKALAIKDTAVNIFARVTDDKMLSYDSEIINVLITDNTPPVVAIAAPVDGAVLKEGDEIVITTNATDNDKVDLVEFFINGVKIGEDGLAPYELKWKAVLGTADIIAIATDNKGAKTTSVVAKVTVEKVVIGIATVNPNKNTFRVYPNPTNNTVFIEFKAGKKNNYKIYDMKGAVVLQKEINNNVANIIEKIDVSELAKGQYTIELLIDNSKATQKLIKN